MSFPVSPLSEHIRRSVDADLPAIERWLLQYENEEPHSTFHCNWNLTRDCHPEGDLLVYVDPESAQPVAYLWGGLIQSGILEVRPDMRRRGIGAALVQRAFGLAAEAEEPILTVQCEPETSLEFWKRMGFSILPRDPYGKIHGYYVLSRQELLPVGGTPARVLVEWLPKFGRNVCALIKQEVDGVHFEGAVHLAERAHCYSKLYTFGLSVRVTVDGEVWHHGPASGDDAEDMGIIRCRNGRFLDYMVSPRDLSPAEPVARRPGDHSGSEVLISPNFI